MSIEGRHDGVAANARRDDPLEVARRFLAAEHPSASAAVLAGSLAAGTSTSTSDLDIARPGTRIAPEQRWLDSPTVCLIARVDDSRPATLVALPEHRTSLSEFAEFLCPAPASSNCPQRPEERQHGPNN